MRRRLRHSLVGVALVATTVAAAPLATTAGAQSWAGFTSTPAPSTLFPEAGGLNDSPAFSASVTADLGGDAVDLWVNNHAESSEVLTDFTNGAFASVVRVTPPGQAFANQLADSHGGAFTDIDGDGDEDFIESAGSGDPNRVFINENGVLTERAADLGDPLQRSRTVIMVDIDNDSDSDALVLAIDSRQRDADEDGEPDLAPSALYINDGGGNFTEVADPDGILFNADAADLGGGNNIRFGVVTSTAPGSDPVVVTANSFVVGLQTLATGTDTLQLTNGIIQSVGVDDNSSNITDMVFGELDGNLQNGPEVAIARADSPTEPVEGALPISMRNPLEAEIFAAVSGQDLADRCRTISLADFDNDADLDIFGGCAGDGQIENIVLLNNGSGGFSLANAAVPGITSTATVSLVADFNDDGWVDTYVGGGFDAEPGEDFVLLNQGGANNFLKVELDTDSDDPIGAQVYVGTDKWQVRETGHTFHRGQDSRTLHFGLAGQSAVAPLEIRWPDGTFETCTIEGINTTVTVTQGSANCVASSAAELQAAISTDPVVVDAPDPGDPDPVDPDPVDPEPTEPLLCNGLEVTVNIGLGERATNSHDVILGTEGPDVINGLDGRDTICALGGDDIINAGQGRDTVFAGAGRDSIEGGQGEDTLAGQGGADFIAGGRGADTILGGAGADELRGNEGRDVIRGGAGADEIRGGISGDILFGENGNDTILGGQRNDVIDGGNGQDVIDGGQGFNDVCEADPAGRNEVQTRCEG